MATIRKRNKGWMVDYRLDGKRFRYQVSNKSKALSIVGDLNKKIRISRDDININKILDTV